MPGRSLQISILMAGIVVQFSTHPQTAERVTRLLAMALNFG